MPDLCCFCLSNAFPPAWKREINTARWQPAEQSMRRESKNENRSGTRDVESRHTGRKQNQIWTRQNRATTGQTLQSLCSILRSPSGKPVSVVIRPCFNVFLRLKSWIWKYWLLWNGRFGLWPLRQPFSGALHVGRRLHDGAREATALLQQGEARLGEGWRGLLSPGWHPSGWCTWGTDRKLRKSSNTLQTMLCCTVCYESQLRLVIETWSMTWPGGQV